LGKEFVLCPVVSLPGFTARVEGYAVAAIGMMGGAEGEDVAVVAGASVLADVVDLGGLSAHDTSQGGHGVKAW